MRISNFIKLTPLRILLFFVFLTFFIAPCSAICCSPGCMILSWPMAMMDYGFIYKIVDSFGIGFIFVIFINLIYLYLFSCLVAFVVDYLQKNLRAKKKPVNR